MCCLNTLASFMGSFQYRKLLSTRTTLERVASNDWWQFELLVGEAFRHQGYAVEETDLGGADSGIELILRKNGRRTLVQCRQWKHQQVGVSVVCERYGLLTHHKVYAKSALLLLKPKKFLVCLVVEQIKVVSN